MLKVQYAGFSVTVCKQNIQTWPLLTDRTPPVVQALCPDIVSVAHATQLTREITYGKKNDELFVYHA